MREPVAVADDELLEGQLGVAQRPAARGAASVAPRRRAGRRGGARRARRSARGAGDAVASRAGEVETRVVAEDWAAHDSSRRPKRSPIQPRPCGGACNVRRRSSSSAGAAARARCGRWPRRRKRKLGLHARPYVLQLGAHGSVDPLSPKELTTNKRGARGPGQATITDALRAVARLLATAGKITRRPIVVPILQRRRRPARPLRPRRGKDSAAQDEHR